MKWLNFTLVLNIIQYPFNDIFVSSNDLSARKCVDVLRYHLVTYKSEKGSANCSVQSVPATEDLWRLRRELGGIQTMEFIRTFFFLFFFFCRLLHRRQQRSVQSSPRFAFCYILQVTLPSH